MTAIFTEEQWAELPEHKKIAYKKYVDKELELAFSFKMLFVGSLKNPEDFYQKGGLEAIRVCEELQKTRYVKLFIKCQVPKELKRRCEKNPNIEVITERLSDEDMDSLFENCDVLLSLNQTYVLSSVLEALSFGKPVIAYDTYAVRDMFKDGENGFIIKPPEECENIYKDKRYPCNIRTGEALKMIKEEHPAAIKRVCSRIKLLMGERYRK